MSKASWLTETEEAFTTSRTWVNSSEEIVLPQFIIDAHLAAIEALSDLRVRHNSILTPLLDCEVKIDRSMLTAMWEIVVKVRDRSAYPYVAKSLTIGLQQNGQVYVLWIEGLEPMQIQPEGFPEAVFLNIKAFLEYDPAFLERAQCLEE